MSENVEGSDKVLRKVFQAHMTHTWNILWLLIIFAIYLTLNGRLEMTLDACRAIPQIWLAFIFSLAPILRNLFSLCLIFLLLLVKSGSLFKDLINRC